MVDGEQGTRWILGFDGGCAACNKLAKDIVDLGAGKLVAAPLRSCLLLRWREQTLGTDAPWRPTLFAVEGEKVRAWTGPALGWHLARLLGPGKTWQIVRMLGELNSDQKPGDAADPSRRRAVRALGGAAVALGIVVGRRSLSPTSVGAQDVGTAGQPRWTFAKPDPAVRRRMEDEWQGAELRAFRTWLDQHGYRRDAKWAPQYVLARRNGELSHKTVTEAWRDGTRVAVVSLLVSRSGKVLWKTNIHRESDGDLVRRLRINEARRAEEEPRNGVAAASVANPCDWDWVWCPSSSEICQGTCALFIGTGGALGVTDCFIGCYTKWGPLWGTVCSGVCSSLVIYGALAVQEFGCNSWFCGEVMGTC